MKQLFSVLITLFLIIPSPSLHALQPPDQPDLAELSAAPGQSPSAAALVGACNRYNDLNTSIRDGKISKEPARSALKRLLAEVRQRYELAGGRNYTKTDWTFPLAGYDSRAITGGSNKGYIASGYDFYTGNRHGGHPAVDIFIRDRDQDSLDDRANRPVTVLSVTGGIVVALEREWEQGSGLRGGKYLWIYDPANDLLVYYAHNSELLVGLGDMVKPGDAIAKVGRSGFNAHKRRSPTHLHLSVLRVQDGWPLPLNVYQDLAHAKTIAAQ